MHLLVGDTNQVPGLFESWQLSLSTRLGSADDTEGPAMYLLSSKL